MGSAEFKDVTSFSGIQMHVEPNAIGEWDDVLGCVWAELIGKKTVQVRSAFHGPAPGGLKSQIVHLWRDDKAMSRSEALPRCWVKASQGSSCGARVWCKR